MKEKSLEFDISFLVGLDKKDYYEVMPWEYDPVSHLPVELNLACDGQQQQP